MSNIFQIRPSLHAPLVASVGFGGATGGPWDADIAGTFIAWLGRQETDSDFCGFLSQQSGITSFTPGSDDRLAFGVRRLSKRYFDHLSLYITQDDGFTVKAQPIAGSTLLFGNIPPYATEVEVDDVLDGTTHKRQVPLVSVTGRSTSDVFATALLTDEIQVAGDITDTLVVGEVVWIDGSDVGNDGAYVIGSFDYNVTHALKTTIFTVNPVPADSTDPPNNPGTLHYGHPVFRIAGNRRINFPTGITFDIINSTDNDETGLEVESVAYAVEDGGEYTDIMVVPSGAVLQENSGADGQLLYSTNYIEPTYAANAADPINISLIQSCDFVKRTLNAETYDGRHAPLSLARNTAIRQIVFEFDYGGITAEHLFRLNKYARHSIPVLITDVSDGDVIQFDSSFSGYLEIANDLGSREKVGSQLIRVTFNVESEQDNLVDVPAGGSGQYFPQIVDADTIGASDTITLEGDWTWLIFKGKHIQINESTNLGNAIYAVDLSAYDAANDLTVVTVFPDLAADTAPDGYVTVLGYE